MNKNIEKRLTIKDVLDHEWIKKFFYKEVKKRESYDIQNMINDNEQKYDYSKQKNLKKAMPRKSSTNGAYRLYADISEGDKK